MSQARLAPVVLPEFGRPTRLPELTPALYRSRLARARQRAAGLGYDVVIVYADREHSANVAYLTGFDPRFEEALLVVRSEGDGEPAILVGNECVGMAAAAPLPLRPILYQELSLNDQPRDRSRDLEAILRDEGVELGARVGIAGWKTYARPDWLEAPAFLVDTVRAIVGQGGMVENASGIFSHAADGLRTDNEAEQLISFEYASCHTSEGVKRLLRGLRPGMTEQEAVALLGWNGMPLSCHLMLTAGPRASLGLLSPSDREVERGDPFTTAFGVWGALTCRAGFVVADAAELPATVGDYVERLVAPYFAAVAEWYAALRIGQTGGELQAIVDRRMGDAFFGIFLNPGHLVLHDQHRGRRRPRRRCPARGTGGPRPGDDGPGVGSSRLHARFARHRAARGRPAALEHRRVADAVPARHEPGDDAAADRLSQRSVQRTSAGGVSGATRAPPS